MLRRLLTKSLRIARGLGREKQEGCRCDGLGGAARLGRGRQMLYAVFCKQPGPRMLRKALLLSLLLHVLLLAALAHTIRLAPAPQLPFMLELRVESAAPPGQVQSTPERRPPVAARPAPAQDKLRPTPPPAATPRPVPAAVETAAQPQPVPVNPAPAVNGSAGAPAPAVAATSGPGSAAGPAPAGESRGVRLVSAPRPDYPPLARQLGEEGTVWLKLSVNEQGRVSAVTLQRSSGFARLDKAGQAAVWQWRFAPKMEAGKTVVAEVELPVRFDLQKSE